MYEASARALNIANEIGRVEFDVLIFSIITLKYIPSYICNVLTFWEHPRKRLQVRVNHLYDITLPP